MRESEHDNAPLVSVASGCLIPLLLGVILIV
jgi:hypothetical protein